MTNKISEVKAMNWIAYNQLAWTDTILARPEDFEEEATMYVNLIKRHISTTAPTMLHVGCGAGGHDYHFKKHFSVTGVDLSEGMLEIARKRNPEIEYLQGDMRTVCLDRKFDVVAIPDSIMYMTTLEDLSTALTNAAAHLKLGGVLLVVAHTKEEFRNNNFAYTGETDNTHITVLENNHIVSDTTYEAAMIYLIRQGGHLEIYHEVHTLGLFSYDEWLGIFDKLHLKVEQTNLDHLYDRYLLEDGAYKLKVFVATPV